jgi:hypothetical protein
VISLGGDSILLRGEGGELEPYALASLQEEVREALSLVGRDADGIAEDLMRVIRHYAATAVRNGRVMAWEEVRRLVLRILRDAGCADAAAVMAPNDLGAIQGTLISAEEAALAAVLGEDPRFVGLDRTTLARRLCEALGAAGIPGVTAAGAIELATSLILSDRDTKMVEASAPATSANYWLFEGESWGGMLTAPLEAAVAAGQLRLYPVSRLAPLVQVIVDLRRFPGSDTELLLLPALDELIVSLAEALAGVPAALAAASADVEAETVRGSVRLVGGDVVLLERLQLSGAQLYSFMAELTARVEGRLRGLAWLRVDCAEGPFETASSRPRLQA